MLYNHKRTCGIPLLFLLLTFTLAQNASGQDTETELGSKSTYHNQLYFNRFFINPTFSLVRENKSYLNILHRNQYTSFEDNRQNYFLGFSNKLNEHTALGIGVYSQWSGVVQEFGFNANYATAVKLGDNSKLTFGTNLTYFTEGLDRNRVIVATDDSRLAEAKKESKLAIQPGINLSLGNFDFGLYAKDLLRYNQTTNIFLTNLSEKSIKASLQYTHSFNSQKGLFENARLMPLLQLGKNIENEYTFIGSLLLDMPNYGWLQTNFDDTYGMSLGLGFNLNKKMSLGYLLEKDLLQKDADLGWNHEVSLAYTFSKTDDTEEWAENSEDKKVDRIIRNYEEQILQLTAEKNRSPEEEILKNKLTINKLAHENRLILDQLILRQDSIEAARDALFEKRFEMIVRAVRTDIKNSIKSKLINQNTTQTTALAVNTSQTKVKAKEKYSGFKELPIKMLNQSDIVGAKSGYYVIANVYKSKKYLNAFMTDLKEKGLSAKKFYNKENGLYYVYLADYNYKKDAQTAYVSNLDGKYQDEKWIMEVANNSTIVLNSYDN
jgi:type IX secretion system PorP/SprF family membrane protein